MDSTPRHFFWAMACALVACGPVEPHESVPRAGAHRGTLQGERWYGTITSTYTQQRSQDLSGPMGPLGCQPYEKSWEETTSSTLKVNLLGERATLDWSWKLRQDERSVETCASCVHRSTGTLTEAGSGNVPVDFGFGVDPFSGMYAFNVGPQEGGTLRAIRVHDVRGSGCDFPDQPGEPGPVMVSRDSISVMDQLGDPKGDSFSGSTTREYTDEGLVETEVITWSFSRVGDLELVVRPRKYEDWRPRGSLDARIPGDVLWVEATVQYKGGAPSDIPAKWIQFELPEVSKVPGIAMNYPPSSSSAVEAQDLDFHVLLNPHLVVSGERNQVARTHDGAYLTELAGVASYDWGAYGELKVTAELVDGRILTGHLEGSAESRILIPQRAPDSFIANGWKRDRGAQGLADADDDENNPVPDVEGHTGDGLTLYEEYRGFIEGYEQGLAAEGPGFHWADGDPRKKDLFVVNQVGSKLEAGLLLFERASGLRLHRFISSSNLASDRTINFRHTGTALHQVDQHAVNLELIYDFRDFAETVPGPGLPREVERIEIPRNFVLDRAQIPAAQAGFRRTVALRNWTVAHELAHACTVRHHGDTDDYRSWRFDTSGQVEEVFNGGAQPIRPLLESNLAPFTLGPQVLPKDFWVTQWHGQSSGDTSCLMRYATASANTYRVANDARLLFDAEPLGFGFCTSKQGTQFNAPTWSPHSRHGDAAVGDCRHQICVNDRYTHSR